MLNNMNMISDFWKTIIIKNVPKREEGFLSQTSKTGCNTKHEGHDSKGCVDRHQGSAETGGGFVAHHQEKEAEEADGILEFVIWIIMIDNKQKNWPYVWPT